MPGKPGERDVLEAKKKVSRGREELAASNADRPGKSRPGNQPLDVQCEAPGDEIGFTGRWRPKPKYGGSMSEREVGD